MGALDEFRKLNDLVKSDRATPEQRSRWAALKLQLIETTRTDTPAEGSQVVRVSATGR